MNETLFEGGCLCGAIRYRSTLAPVRCMICHCEQCRKHSGSVCLSFVHFPKAAFQWLGQEPQRYRSSQFAERGFCGRCGSTLSMHEEVLADRIQIATGSLDQPERVHPDDHVWVQSQIPWLTIADNAPKFERSSSAVPSEAEVDRKAGDS